MSRGPEEGRGRSAAAGPGALPAVLRGLLSALLPAARREDVLGDLEASHRARRERLGPARARRLLLRELLALAAWRMGAGRVPAGERRGGAAPGVGSTGGGGMDMIADILRDLRFGARALARQPGFTTTALVVLGLGIGAPATVLTVVDRVFFERPAHVEEPHRLFRLYRTGPGFPDGASLQHADYLHYRGSVGSAASLAAYGGSAVLAARAPGGEPHQLRGLFVSDNYFDVLGVRPRSGRFFLREEGLAPGTHPVAVVSEGYWRRALGADPSVVGRSVEIAGILFTVVGVAPSGFSGVSLLQGAAPDAWLPIAMAGAVQRQGDTAWWERLPDSRTNWLTVVGRLAPGATFEAAEARLDAISDALAYEGRAEDESVLLSREALYHPAQARLLSRLSRLLLAAVGVVLVIAAANVAVLLLTRAVVREREMGIRTAVGAGRGRLVRQLLAESLLLGLGGGALGVGLAYALGDTVGALLPYRFASGFTPDLRVLAATTALSLLTSFLVGLAPALHVVRADLSRLVEGARSTRGRSFARDGLVVAQVALSLVLVAGALLFARSFHAARAQDVGFEAEGRLALRVDLRAQGYSDDEVRAFLPRALERLAAIPGVEGVAATRMIPFQGDWTTTIAPPAGVAPDTPGGELIIGMNVVSPEYFEVMGIPIVAGRTLQRDDPAGPMAGVVNESLARALFRGEDPLGRTVAIDETRVITVVGVARDATYYELGEGPTFQLYGQVSVVAPADVGFVLRSAGDAADLAGPAQDALREIDPDLAFRWVSTLEAVMADQTARFRVAAVLVGLFGLMALALASAGLYGVVGFLVAQRTREIGVRMALGAGRGRVAGQVVGSGLRLAGLGIALGLPVALLLRRLTASFLYGTVEADDPWPLVAACAVLCAVVAAAAFGPARRAARVDPLEAIRSD